jgi:hypothetical protein
MFGLEVFRAQWRLFGSVAGLGDWCLWTWKWDNMDGPRSSERGRAPKRQFEEAPADPRKRKRAQEGEVTSGDRHHAGRCCQRGVRPDLFIWAGCRRRMPRNVLPPPFSKPPTRDRRGAHACAQCQGAHMSGCAHAGVRTCRAASIMGADGGGGRGGPPPPTPFCPTGHLLGQHVQEGGGSDAPGRLHPGVRVGHPARGSRAARAGAGAGTCGCGHVRVRARAGAGA